MIAATLLSLAQFHPQTPEAAAETARWVVHNVNWGYLTTIGDDKKPTAEVASFSDGASDKSTGRIFFYMMGGSTASFPGALTVCEAAFNGTCGFAGSKVDPEDPRCAKLTLSGTIAKCSGADASTGKAALFARHPQMKSWPADHGFAVYELAISDIWMIDFYGGGAGVTPALFLKVSPKNNRPSWPPSPAPGLVETTTAARDTSAFCDEVADNAGCCPACGYTWSGHVCTTTQPASTPYCQLLTEPRHSGCCVWCGHVWSAEKGKCVDHAEAPVAEAPPPWNHTAAQHGAKKALASRAAPALPVGSFLAPRPHAALGPPGGLGIQGRPLQRRPLSPGAPPSLPPRAKQAARARWLVAHSMWTAISTTSVRLRGAPWGNVRSIADAVASTGVPYFYLPAPDPTQERAGVDGSRACGGMDAEDPTCARLLLSGTAVALTSNRSVALAEAALKAKHPLAPWLAQGGAHTGGKYYTIEISSLQFLDFYGGYAKLSVEEYLGA